MYKSFILKTIVNCSYSIPKRCAGHSKWANIKHTKGEKDTQRSKLFVKLLQRMRVAIQDGGSVDPEKNLSLYQVIEIAKSKNMPAQTIQNFLKSAQSDKSKGVGMYYELRGPRGIFLILSALTEQPKRTKDNIASAIKKHNENSARHLFAYKGIISSKPPQGLENPSDVIIEDAIECGAEEVFPSEVDDGVFDFICDANQLNNVKGKLVSKKYEIVSTDIELIPDVRIEINENEMEAMGKLIEKLEALPEVIRIYDNIK